jgi:hypothetical protein
VAIEDMAMLTILFPTRIVTSSRWGSLLRSARVSAPATPSSTIFSSRWGASENIAISDEEKKADSATRRTMTTTPTVTNNT